MSEKYCPKCKQIKSIGDFFKNRSKKDGHDPQCKKCKAAYVHEYRQRDDAKARLAEYRQRPDVKEKKRQEGYRYRTKYKDEIKERYKGKYKGKYKGRYQTTINEGVKRWLAQDPNRAKAHKAVNSAVKKGKLSPVAAQSCVQCGQRAFDYHHHKGYAPEHWLNVIPVCRNCHKAIHSQ